MLSRILAVIVPIFVGLLPILSLFDANTGEVWVSDFLVLSSILSLMILILMTIFFLIKKNIFHASLSTIICVLPLSIVNETHHYHINLIIWSTAAIAALLFLCIPIKTDLLKKIEAAIFVPLSVLVVFYGISISISKIRIENVKTELEKKFDLDFLALKDSQNKKEFNSDIYFIILDEFVSPIAFRDYYKYNNEAFFSFLEDTGFHLVRYPYANYPWTIPSVSSMVSMDYHKNWVPKKDFPQIAHFLIRYNMPAKLLKSDGYQFFSFPSVYWLGNASKGIWEDFLFRAKSYGLTMSVLRSTPLSNIAREYQKIEHRNHILNQLSQLEEIAKTKTGKKFVFAHFLCPHRPIVFDKEGRGLEEAQAGLAEKDQNHNYYLDQAYFISHSIQQLIKTIFASSNTPPLIVVLSDHGKFPIGVTGKGKTTLPLCELSWRLSNFMALYLPDKSIKIPDTITPVNIFPMILNDYHGHKIPSQINMCHPDFFDLEKEEPPSSLIPFQYKNDKSKTEVVFSNSGKDGK